MPASHTHRGFTLVELMITLALSLLTLSVVYSIYLAHMKVHLLQENLVVVQENLRASLDLMGKELRMAGYDPSGANRDGNRFNDFSGIELNHTQLVIQADLNGNGKLGDTHESIGYWYDVDTNTLRRTTGGGRQPVAENIEKFEFRLMDHDRQIATQASEIRSIKLEITGKTAQADPAYPHNNGYRTMTLSSLVVPRNLQIGQ